MTVYLVTGATGFVGQALTRRLLGGASPAASPATNEVRVLVRNAEAGTHALPGTRPQVASLGDPNAIADAARGVDVIFHCAGENDARAAPQAFSWINVAGTENVINAARHAGVRRVVHLSCADATLVNRDRMSWKETTALSEAALDACTRSKLLAEELALQANARELEVCALRPAWIWGAGDRRTLPALYEESQRGRVQLCGNGKNLVPTTNIANIVDAFMLASSAERAPGHAYHVLDAELLNAAEFLGHLCNALGVAAPARSLYTIAYTAACVRARLNRPGLTPADVVRRGRSSLFDAQAAARDLHYQPNTSLEAGLQTLSSWLTEIGGPKSLLPLRRHPSTEADIAPLIRLAT